MAVVAYSPIAKGRVGDNETLSRIGAAHKKSAAQVCLRFLVQQNIVVIPRTSKVERLSENAAIFDFALGAREMADISALARRDGRLVNSISRASKNGIELQNSTSSSSNSSGSLLAAAIHSCISGIAMIVLAIRARRRIERPRRR